MGLFKVVEQETKPIDGQKPGTSGLRKKVLINNFRFYLLIHHTLEFCHAFFRL